MTPPNCTKLVFASANPETTKEYRSALDALIDNFVFHDNSLDKVEGVDDILVEYTHHLYYLDSPLQHKSLAGKTASALKFFVPELCHRLPVSTRANQGWDRCAPSQQHTPCPQELTLGIAYYIWRADSFSMAVVVLLSLECYLRQIECRGIRRKHITFDPSPRYPCFWDAFAPSYQVPLPTMCHCSFSVCVFPPEAPYFCGEACFF